MTGPEIEIDRSILSNSTWVADCLDCPTRQALGSQTEAYNLARGHIAGFKKHNVLVYAATMLFKAPSGA